MNWNRNFWISAFCFSFAALTAPRSIWAEMNPEKDTLKISQRLKPISDEDWTQIAGDRIKEKYTIAKGDTLYGISAQLFGDGKYWPKLWALNNNTILNAHLIYPNNELIFEPGTGFETPTTTFAAAEDNGSTAVAQTDENGNLIQEATGPTADAPVTLRSSGRSSEWKNLPRQDWEPTPLDKNIVEISSAEKAQTTPESRFGFSPRFYLSDRSVEPIAEIQAIKSYARSLNLDDLVFLEALDEGALQTGQEYAILGEPTTLKSAFSSRKGMNYPIVAVVRVQGTKDGLYVSKVTQLLNFGQRGSIVIPMPPRWKTGGFIPGDKEQQAIVMTDKSVSTDVSSAGRFVFLDRGSSDGVQNGMVFRMYETKDPATNKRYTRSNFVYNADIVVVQTSNRMSIGFILDGVSLVPADSVTVLLTNVDELANQKRFREKLINMDNNESGAPSAPIQGDSLETASPIDEDLDLDDEDVENEVRAAEDDALDLDSTPEATGAEPVEESLDEELGTDTTEMPEAEPGLESESSESPGNESGGSETDLDALESELDDIPE